MKKDIYNKTKSNMKNFMDEFKTFIQRGNVIDLAVGVIIGTAFGKIVTSLVNDILMPIIGIIIGGHNFNDLKIKIGDTTILYGSFIQNIVDFLIVALFVFIFIKIINKIMKNDKKGEKKEVPKKSDEIIILEDIRDLLKKMKK